LLCSGHELVTNPKLCHHELHRNTEGVASVYQNGGGKMITSWQGHGALPSLAYNTFLATKLELALLSTGKRGMVTPLGILSDPPPPPVLAHHV
jgi:hypothetical protein